MSACSGLASADLFPSLLQVLLLLLLFVLGEFWPAQDLNKIRDYAAAGKIVHVNSVELFILCCGRHLNAQSITGCMAKIFVQSLSPWRLKHTMHTRCGCLLATHCSKSSAVCEGRGLEMQHGRKSYKFKQTEQHITTSPLWLSVSVIKKNPDLCIQQVSIHFNFGRRHAEGPWKDLLWKKGISVILNFYAFILFLHVYLLQQAFSKYAAGLSSQPSRRC